MVKRLVIIGDSFCHGIGTATPFKDTQNTKQAFGQYVADAMCLEYVNLAEPGTGVSRAVEVGYEFLSRHPDSVCIAGWSQLRRIGLYNNNIALQILPSYALLGNTQDQDVVVKEKDSVKFVTDKQNQSYLDMLPQLHQACVQNNLFDGMVQVAGAHVAMFRAWCKVTSIKLLDFNVFTGYDDITQPHSHLTFGSVMHSQLQHPTAAEQRKFADLWISKYV
jgi:hypothetical protein